MKFDPDALLAADNRDPKSRGSTPRWSFSSLQIFKQCPHRVYLKYVEGLPDEAGPAAERGSQIHDQCEAYVRGETTELPGARKMLEYKERMDHLIELYQDGKVQMEENWGFDIDWSPVDWNHEDIWHRSKLDVFIRWDATSAKIIDYKTGRSWGNAIKHNEQGLCYATASMMLYPELEHVEYSFWYLDENKELTKQVTRDQVIQIFKPMIEEEAYKMTSAVEYPAHPDEQNCRWCPYKENNQCSYYDEWQRSRV